MPCFYYYWCLQAMHLGMDSLAKDVVPLSWSLYAAVALRKISWTVATMVWVTPHVATMKMLEFFAKVREMKNTLTDDIYNLVRQMAGNRS